MYSTCEEALKDGAPVSPAIPPVNNMFLLCQCFACGMMIDDDVHQVPVARVVLSQEALERKQEVRTTHTHTRACACAPSPSPSRVQVTLVGWTQFPHLSHKTILSKYRPCEQLCTIVLNINDAVSFLFKRRTGEESLLWRKSWSRVCMCIVCVQCARKMVHEAR